MWLWKHQCHPVNWYQIEQILRPDVDTAPKLRTSVGVSQVSSSWFLDRFSADIWTFATGSECLHQRSGRMCILADLRFTSPCHLLEMRVYHWRWSQRVCLKYEDYFITGERVNIDFSHQSYSRMEEVEICSPSCTVYFQGIHTLY